MPARLRPDARVASPIVKWAGGKSRLIPELVARLPRRWNRYYEPFGGGLALFFHLAPTAAVIGDANVDLMHMYSAVKSDVAGVMRRLRSHEAQFSKRWYDELRAAWNASRTRWSAVRRAAALIAINRSCFNGLYRVNRRGEFNVPFGRYTNPTLCMTEALLGAHAVLQHAEIRTGDYRQTLRDAARGDVAYLDPPYAPVSSTANFTSYTRTEFGDAEQLELADVARELVDRGVRVIVSNSPRMRRAYEQRGFRVETVKCTRSINSNGARRGEVDELVISS